MTKPTFAEWAERCTPRMWHLRVRPMRADGQPRPPIAMPEDRDIAGALARSGAPVGRYSVTPFLAIRGRGSDEERLRIGLEPQQRPASTIVAVREDDGAQIVRSVRPLDDEDEVDDFDEVDDEDEVDDDDDAAPESPAIAAAREAAAIAKLAAAQARQEAERARHEAERRQAEAQARQFAAQAQAHGPAAATDAGVVAMLREVIDQLRAQNAELRQEIATMRAQLFDAISIRTREETHTRPLEALKESLGLLGAVREMMQQQEPAEPADSDSPLAWIRELARVLPALQGATQPQPHSLPPASTAPAAASLPGGAANGAAPRPDGAPAASAATAAPAQGMARERCVAFLQRIVAEMSSNTAPDAVADLLGDDVALLPLPVRARLDEADWPGAWSAIAGYLAAEERAELEPWLADASVREWLGQFVAALQVEDTET